jgi:CheY-like chemotaxis protein
LILVVDDNPDLRAIFSIIFGNSGFRVAEAANGAEAVEAAQQEAPDLATLDLMMPHMNGWEVMAEWIDAGKSFPVVAVTASPVDETDVQEAGFCALLRKPVPPDRLVQAANHCLDAHGRGERWIPELASVLSTASS